MSGDYFNVYGMTFSEGNTFNQEQLNGRAQVVVLDSNTRRQLFPHKADVVGEVILVGNMPARVIGVAEEKQSMFGSGKSAACLATLRHDVRASYGPVVAELHYCQGKRRI